jgi:Bacterial Ig-like domain (group 3)
MRRDLMRGRRTRRGAALVAGLALTGVGLAGTVVAVPAAQADARITAAAWDPNETTPVSAPGMAVSLAQAGELGLWGDNAYGQSTVPASLEGVAIKQLVRPDGRSTLALTAAGKVVGWGANHEKLEQVPAEVAAAKVVQIAADPEGGFAGAVTADGRVLVWGKKRVTANPAQVPAGLTGVKQLVMGSYAAGALKADGSVVTWGLLKAIGEPDSLSATPPAGLKATAIATTTLNHWLALKEDGSLVAWGARLDDPTAKLPANLTVPGSVKAITSNSVRFLVLRTDNKLQTVNAYVYTQNDSGGLVTDFLATDAVLLSTGGNSYELAAVDRQRAVHYWRPPPTPWDPVFAPMPTTFDGRNIVQVALGNSNETLQGDPRVAVGGVIITKMLRAELPQVDGVRRVGSTLTATPGTFSASPDSVTGQWLVDGSPIDGQTGTTFTVTAAQLGHEISYRSTATKTGETTISSTSAPVKVPAPATVGLSVAKGTYGVAATVTASVAGAAGNVSLTVDGKPVGTKALVGGKASFSVARTTLPGNHAVKATYAGGSAFGPGTKTGTLSVGKGRTGRPVVRVAKASPKKVGTVTVTVPTAAGLVKATGKAQLVLKKGRSIKKVNLAVRKGRAVGKLPKLPKGTWTATVTYRGSTYYVPAKSRTIKVK